MQYQSLWDMENDDVEAVLQSDLNLWMQMLGEIKQARATFDTAKQQRVSAQSLLTFASFKLKSASDMMLGIKT